MRRTTAILLLLARGAAAAAFVRPMSSFSCSSSSALSMINNLFNNKDSSSTSSTKRPTQQQQLPRDVKEAVSKCREATQAALADRTSRMTVDFPVGAKFGVEKKTKSSSKQQNLDSSDSKTPTRHDLQKSDRELSRIFVEMFQPVGGQHLTVAFNTVEEADAARMQWKGDPSAEARILSLDRRKSSAAKKKKKAKSKASAKGFAAKLAAEIDDDDSGNETGPFRLPDNTEVALIVAPGPKELIVIERICEAVGMGTLVVLLNARLPPSSSGSTTSSTNSNNYFGSPAAENLFTTDFETVFSLAAVTPQEAAPGCLLYRSYIASDWVLARKPAVGPPKTILAQATRPTEAECRAAWEDALEQLSGVEKNVETAMENVAQWFR